MTTTAEKIEAKVPRREQLAIIESVRQKIKKNQVVIDAFKEHSVDIDELDLIPMKFGELDVSARTEAGVITFNYALLDDGDFEQDDHYMVHEVTHYLQQSNKATKSSNDDNYLDNKSEQEGFKNQSEYISDTQGDSKAENYIDQVLDHHDVDNQTERDERKKQLLEFAK